MKTGLRYLVYLIWCAGVFFSSIYIFTSGFLLQRHVLPNQTLCNDARCIQPPAVYKKAIILLVDALRYDFCTWNTTLAAETAKIKSATSQSGKQQKVPETKSELTGSIKNGHYFRNQLPVFEKYSQKDAVTGARHGKLYKFLADPPTTTMQRLKGMTTGSLPTFIDVSSNFASYEIQEDNLINQIIKKNKTIFFSGDDTWTSLYPDSFVKSDPQPSFDVWDLDSVDTAVTKFIHGQLSGEWDVLIGHYLGVDHAGHKYGPNHPEMTRKLGEMNSAIQHVVQNLPNDTILLVFGDHGMTDSGDHGGGSSAEVEAALFVYGKKLAFNDQRGAISSVSQIDLVPTLSLLLGIPIPFSNLGMMIEDLFIPTMLLPDDGSHTKLTSFSKDDLIKFRMSYMKTNVNQVHRYLTSYLGAGGQFPEKTNSMVRKLASEVINRPGAMSPHETMVLYSRCKEFLKAAKEMCQSVWVNFDDKAITSSLTFILLHLMTLTLLLCKPQHRLLSTFISGFILIILGASILIGSLFGASVAVIGEKLDWMVESGGGLFQLLLVFATFITIVANAMCLLWKLRYSLKELLFETIVNISFETFVTFILFILISVSVVSNSFVIGESGVVCFCLVSLLILSSIKHTRSILNHFLVIFSVGLIRVCCVYIRCREEHGPECTLTQFHKPLSTLDHETSFYRNWRYFITLMSLLIITVINHVCLSTAGNLNGLFLSVLVAKYLPGIISVMMASYWALQAFPSPLVMKILPWQHNMLAIGVFATAALGVIVILISPRLVYFKRDMSRGQNSVLTDFSNIPGYFNYMKSNWKSHGSLVEKTGTKTLGYGLGTCISAPVLCILVLTVLVSMLISGDGQSPAVLSQFLLILVIIIMSAHFRLKQKSCSVENLLNVPFSHLFVWILLESLSFFITGHQATFPHIQWSAAFIGLEGTQLAGESYSGHIIPGLLIGWNTFSCSLLSSLALPLLMFAPFSTYLLIPTLRPRSHNTHHQHTNGTGGLFTSDIYKELERGESLLLDHAENVRNATFNLSIKFLVIKGFKVFCCMLSAAVLRRHLMVWKIFAPKFIFEAVGFMVSVVALLAANLVTSRVFNFLTISVLKWKMS